MITEILEEDFRKLDLKGYVYSKGDYRVVDLNDELTSSIEYWIESGYESNLKDLQYPVTIAIHTNSDIPNITNCYFDKFMNSYTGFRTYQLGMGIKHLYSTRDYYEDHEDYWRVKKNETKVVFRVHLDKKWLDKFVLKHKKVVSEVYEEGKHWVEELYDLENGEWVLKGKNEIIKNEGCTIYKNCKK